MKTLTNALPIVAAAYGRTFNIPVQVGGDEAMTDGKVIRIPAVPDHANSLAYGYLAHEAGHVRFTDFELARHENPLGRFVEGILEDVRIENAMIRAYPGTRSTLDSVVDALIAEGKLVPVTDQAGPVEILGNGLLHLARHRYRKQPALANHAKHADQVMRRVLGARFVHRLHGLLTEIPTLKSTAESMALARKIIALVEQESQDASPQPTAEEEDDTPSEDDEHQAQGSGRQDPGTQNPDDEDADQAESEERGAQNPDEEGTDDGSEHPEPSARNQGQEICNALREALTAGEEELPEDLFATVADALGAESLPSPTLLPTKEPYEGNRHYGGLALHRVKVHSAKLTARLQGLVQAHTLTRHRTVQRGRSLSPAHLHRAGVGDPRIFRIKEHKVAPDTALHLLVDLSGSMAGGQDGIALDAAMALALALEPIKGVSRAVSAFPGLRGQDQNVTAILAHGERVATRAGAFVQCARGGTPMTGALWFAAADLLSRSETRKVLLTLTDGEPNDVRSAKDLITRATQAGVECIGIGIRHDVGRLFPVAVRIDDIADLKTALFGIAERLLLA
ncbi:cobaltochelatase CobT-related protein [Thiocapsa rosea]|uniref:Cobalamin biosynthesis protein CobT n=1 Tax=Thiocapsa rosea TaxID=69360 RepID=A0A495VC80_9GAMM|nr:VWA domain-containing protein [Thiocapsa rosea]RKT47021.1 cobalamin biosynthesis protein CobT [Thiocapsa rosea]